MRSVDEYRDEIMEVICESGDTKIVKKVIEDVLRDRDLAWSREMEGRGYVRTADEIRSKLNDK